MMRNHSSVGYYHYRVDTKRHKNYDRCTTTLEIVARVTIMNFKLLSKFRPLQTKSEKSKRFIFRILKQIIYKNYCIKTVLY